MLYFGEQCEVWKILIGCAPGYGEPLAAYCAGYRFAHYEEGTDTALVFTKFNGHWIKVRYYVRDIRSLHPTNMPKVWDLQPVRC